MLTELKIKHATPGFWPDSNGLYLQVSKAGTKSWIYRYQLNGKRREMGLGGLANVSAKEARIMASEARALVFEKIDPIDSRKEKQRQATEEDARLAAKKVTFKELALEFIENKRPGWKNAKHAAQWANTLATYVFPIFGNLAVGDINTDHVLQVLNPIFHTKTETASRVRNRIEMVLDYAKFKKLREGENPARWRGHLDNKYPKLKDVKKVTNHPALDHVQIKDFVRKLRNCNGISALCLEFTILTACRSGEVLNSTWEEINNDVWTIPAKRMKAGKEHIVPLTPAMLEILAKAKLLQQSDYIFPGARLNRPLTEAAVRKLLLNLHPGITTHGFRSTFRTWVGDKTNYPRDLAELALAHSIGNIVEQTYDRSRKIERRRQLMIDWSSECDPVQVGDKVVSISAIRASAA